MNVPDDDQWSRIAELIETCDDLPPSRLPDKIEHLKKGGESSEVLSYLRLNYSLPTSGWEVGEGSLIGGRYRVLNKLGEGGMGVVFLAHQERVNRDVALKMMHPSLATPSLVDRLAGEISTLGRLNHPNIVRIFDADVHRGERASQEALYYTMEVVDGTTLSDWVRAKTPTLEEKLECLAGVCDAVSYAHEHSVIHRDLKPGNILIRTDGQPAVLDFGLARVTEIAMRSEEDPMEENQEIFFASGTPAYMSPEKWQRYDDREAGDIYAIGVMLFEFVAGRRPWRFGSDTSISVMRETILGSAAPRLRDVYSNVDPSIDALTARLLATEPENRPGTASEVATELRRIVRSIRRRATVRKHLPMLSVSALALATTLGFFIENTWRTSQHRKSERAFGEAQRTLNNPPPDVRSRIHALVPTSPRKRHTQSSWRDILISGLTHWELAPRTLPDLPDGFSPLATDNSGAHYLGQLSDGTWALAGAGGDISPYPGTPPETVIFHPTRPVLVTVTRSGAVASWDWETGAVKSLGDFTAKGSSVAFSPDGKLLATESTDEATAEEKDISPIGTTRIFCTEKWSLKHSLVAKGSPHNIYSRPASGIAFSPGSTLLATTSTDSLHVLIWNLETGELDSFAYHVNPVQTLAWHPEKGRRLLATGRQDGAVSLWSIQSQTGKRRKSPLFVFGQQPSAINRHHWTPRPTVESLTWIPGTGQLLAQDSTGKLDVWSPSDPISPTRTFEGILPVGQLHWHGPGHFFSLRGQDGTWTEWQINPSPIATATRIPLSAQHLSFDPTSQFLSAAGNAGAIFLDVFTWQARETLDPILTGSACFAPHSGDFWAYTKKTGPVRWESTTEDDTIHLRSPVRGNLEKSLGLFAFDTHGGLFALTRGSNIYIRPPEDSGDPASGEVEKKTTLPLDELVPAITLDSGVNTITVSPSGDWLALSWGRSGTKGLWRRLGKTRWEKTGIDLSGVRTLAFHPTSPQLMHGRRPVGAEALEAPDSRNL